MHHNISLITTIAAALGFGLLFGMLAVRMRLPALVGYLAAGVLIGPATPGFVADVALASQLAEIGVMLLMFGVGLHFSLDDLLEVKGIALPGAVLQITVATLMGIGVSHLWGWSLGAGLVFGLALSVASTVVLLRALEDRGQLDSFNGRIAVGWLVVEDLVTVLVLVLLPALAGPLGGHGANADGSGHGAGDSLWLALGKTLLSVGAFVAFMLLVGRKLFPWFLWRVAKTGSRELFTLAVIAAAVGIAYGSSLLFGVSFALGAFFAGMVLRESALSHRAAEETLPLRDAFSVLFFVSVGMLFDPRVLVDHPLEVLAVVAIILFGKSIAAFAIVRLFGYPNATALTISASLAQIGEFAFILAGLGVTLGLLTDQGRDLILAGALLSIMLNPLCFALLDRVLARAAPAAPAGGKAEAPAAPASREPVPQTTLTDHVVLVGHGRVGRFIIASSAGSGIPFLVIEDDAEAAEGMRKQGGAAITGNAADPEVLAATNLAQARCLLVAIPDAFEGGQVVQQARAINAALPIVARAHSEEEIEHLKKHGASMVVMGEHEIAKAMLALIPDRDRTPQGSSAA
jgi:CPA2 family monovalent cation:H+ antiporter-2